MFTTKPKRRDYTTVIFSVVIAALCFLIVAIAWPAEPVENTEPGNLPGIDLGSGTNGSSINGSGGNSGMANGDGLSGHSGNRNEENAGSGDFEGETEYGNSEDFAENNNMNGDSGSYYLVKRAGEQIYVYFCDSSGSMVQLEATEILYSMLGPEDQKLFEEGIRIESQEELSVLLQDFEG